MKDYIVAAYLFISILCASAIGHYDPFADNILFSVNWPGPIHYDQASGTPESIDLPTSETDNLSGEETLVMTTQNNERYKCIIPQVKHSDPQSDLDHYTGPDEMNLLKPLFDQTSCSYRIESYWTYELCHGRFLRQYHEEKEPGKKATLQEYHLGKYKASAVKDSGAEEEASNVKITKRTFGKAPVQKVEGLEIPYFSVNFTDGTVCDLTSSHRQASIHYVCQPEGKGEIYSLKEISTCDYEVVVLTKLLCSHPAYKTKKDHVNAIRCHSLDASPQRPRNLDNMELENTLGRYSKMEEYFDEGEFIDEGLDEEDEDEEGEQEDTVKEEDKKSKATREVPPRPNTVISSNADKQLLSEFLSGDYCIQGGSGWWKHEFCYGKHVTQFHEDKSSKTIIQLGRWDEARHKTWLEMNPAKKPKPVSLRNTITHYYGMGDKCELTGHNRFVEVRLKCKESPNQPHAVAIYLVEPSPCEYVLVVESPILCQLVDQADQYGIIVQT